MNFHQDDLSGVRDTSGQVAVFVIKFTGGRVSEKKGHPCGKHGVLSMRKIHNCL